MKRNEKNQLKVGATLSYIAMFLQNTINIVYTPFLLRSLGQIEYGLYMLMGSVVGYLSIMDFGMSNAVTRYVAKYRAERDRIKESNLVALCLLIYTILGFIAIIGGVILYFNLDLIFAQGLNEDELDRARLMFVLLIINMSLSFPLNTFSAILNGYEKFIVVKSIAIVRIVIVPLIMIPLLLIGYKAIAIIVLNTILNLLIGIFNILYSYFKLNIKIKLYYFDKTFLKELSGYSSFVFLGIIVDQIYWRTGQIVLGMFQSAAAVAIYAIAMQFCNYYMNFATAISSIFLPRVTEMVTKKRDNYELTNLFTRTGRLQLIILGFLLSSFILFGKDFIILWAGKEYVTAWKLALIIMVPLTIPLFQTVGISILQAKNMHAFRSVMYLIVAIVNFGISIILVQYIGSLGIALGTALSLFIGNVIIINFYYHYKVGINIPSFLGCIMKLIPAILASTLIGYFIAFLPGISWLSLLLKGLLYIGVYGGIIWFFGMNEQEKQLFHRPFNGLRKKVLRV